MLFAFPSLRCRTSLQNACPKPTLKDLNLLLLSHHPSPTSALPHQGNPNLAALSLADPFTVDLEKLQLTGSEVPALSEMLKLAFGWKARTTGNCVFPIGARRIDVRSGGL